MLICLVYAADDDSSNIHEYMTAKDVQVVEESLTKLWTQLIYTGYVLERVRPITVTGQPFSRSDCEIGPSVTVDI